MKRIECSMGKLGIPGYYFLDCTKEDILREYPGTSPDDLHPAFVVRDSDLGPHVQEDITEFVRRHINLQAWKNHLRECQLWLTSS